MAQPLIEEERLRLLDALADSAWHSGEALAEASGISRAALAKRIERLRDWELDIEARQGLGYRLTQPLQRLDAEALRRALPQSLRLSVLAETDSTNSQLLAADPARDPQALLAEFQTAGRGRRGRQWRSPFGANLYLSLAWSFPAWPPALTTLPLLVGVVCAERIAACGLARVGVKWPNDLYVDGRKLGGILIEHRGEAGGPCRVVIGIGLNIAMSARQAEGIDQPWIALDAALADTGRPAVSRQSLAAQLLDGLVAALARFEREGFEPFVEAWNRHDLSRDQPVEVLQGEQRQPGIARGIDAQGALIVEIGGVRQHLHSGEISLRLGTP